jgi:hypothetical protein
MGRCRCPADAVCDRKQADDRDDEGEDLTETKCWDLSTLRFHLGIDKLLFYRMSMLGLTFELLQHPFGRARMDFLVLP